MDIFKIWKSVTLGTRPIFATHSIHVRTHFPFLDRYKIFGEGVSFFFYLAIIFAIFHFFHYLLASICIIILNCLFFRYALLVGRPPFETSTLKETYMRITSNKYSIPHHLSHPARNLIAKLLHGEPECRPTLDQILQHEFFNGYCPKTLSNTTCENPPKFSHSSQRWVLLKGCLLLMYRNIQCKMKVYMQSFGNLKHKRISKVWFELWCIFQPPDQKKFNSLHQKFMQLCYRYPWGLLRFFENLLKESLYQFASYLAFSCGAKLVQIIISLTHIFLSKLRKLLRFVQVFVLA